MSDKVHTPQGDTSSGVISDTCSAIAPQPDEWGRLDLHAELARIEGNAAKWEPHPANLIGHRMKADLRTLLAVLRRADSVIRAQAHDLDHLRAELNRVATTGAQTTTPQPSASLLGAIEDARSALPRRATRQDICDYLNAEGYTTPVGHAWTPTYLMLWLGSWRTEGLL